MKVLFSLTYYTPYVSGLTMYVARIAKELTRKGVDVTILTSQHDKVLHCHSEDPEPHGAGDEESPHEPGSQHVGRLHIIRVPYLFKISKGFIMPSYIFESYNAVKNSDVVFVNLPQVEGFIVSLWAKLFHKKLYAIYHCDLVLPAGFFNFFINKIVVVCNSITLALADKIIVYTNKYAESSPSLRFVIARSEATKQSSQKKIAASVVSLLPRNDMGKILQIFPPVFPLPIDEKYLAYLNNKFAREEVSSFGGKIGFAARVAEEKGLEYLIDAIKNLENIKLFIAGPKEEVVGEEKYMKKINRLLEDNKSKIVFLGKLNESQMGAFYKFIDLLVVSSVNRTEAFGLVQAEAMFAGRPVVATNLPGVNFLVQSTGAGEIAKIKNVEDLKEKIEKVRNNYEKYQEKTKNIFKIINLEKTINEFIKLM